MRSLYDIFIILLCAVPCSTLIPSPSRILNVKFRPYSPQIHPITSSPTSRSNFLRLNVLQKDVITPMAAQTVNVGDDAAKFQLSEQSIEEWIKVRA